MDIINQDALKDLIRSVVKEEMSKSGPADSLSASKSSGDSLSAPAIDTFKPQSSPSPAGLGSSPSTPPGPSPLFPSSSPSSSSTSTPSSPTPSVSSGPTPTTPSASTSPSPSTTGATPAAANTPVAADDASNKLDMPIG